MKKLLTLFILWLIQFSAVYTPSVLAQKVDYNGVWTGNATVDFGFGMREKFEYELILTQKKNKIKGVSTTVLTIKSKKYTAKAEIEGEVNGKFLKCYETHNIQEDKIPNSGWIPFSKMELIYRIKTDTNYPTLEGLYQCPDGSNGRLILEKKPPRV
ncbi:MAG: hypothetical protein JNL70_18995 [Saprospiraceae bacterium]|nr:hypothetical protein [Saprospiraceae bacterium]